jgi:hypothetical protein
MLSFFLNGQVYELIAIEVIEDDDGPPVEEFVLRSHCADCGEEFLWRSPGRIGPYPNRRCEAHRQPGKKVKRGKLAEPKKRRPAKPLKAGSACPRSGVYLAQHNDDHRPATHGMVRTGQMFPGCRTCGDKVRYSLVTAVSVMSDREELN